MTDSDYIGSDLIPGGGYLEPRRYRITARCTRCDTEFSWTTTSPGGKNRPCPKRACRDAAYQADVQRAALNMAKIIEEGRAPGIIGDKPIVRAIDRTAEIVMADHGLTDLKDNIRVGETMAPKLPPKLQSAADNFFGGGASAGKAVNRQVAARMNARVARVMRGGGIRVPPAAALGIGRSQGDHALSFVRKEPV